MAVVLSSTERKVLRVKAKRDRVELVRTRLTQELRVLSEQVRAEKRQAVRKKMKMEKMVVERKKDKREAVKQKRVEKKEVKSGRKLSGRKVKFLKKVVRTKGGKKPRGRPAMYAGRCCACAYRVARRKGGPVHDPVFCKKYPPVVYGVRDRKRPHALRPLFCFLQSPASPAQVVVVGVVVLAAVPSLLVLACVFVVGVVIVALAAVPSLLVLACLCCGCRNCSPRCCAVVAGAGVVSLLWVS
jgi:hypothetical protein